MYVDPEKFPVKDYFHTIPTFADNYKIMSTPGPVPKNWPIFGNIRSEYYELDQNFYET